MRNELHILQQVLQIAIRNGFSTRGTEPILGISTIVDPPSLCLEYQGNSLGDNIEYLDPLFPLLNLEWAIAFWGKGFVGDAFTGGPAWLYYQRKLYEIYQTGSMEAFYGFLESFL